MHPESLLCEASHCARHTVKARKREGSLEVQSRIESPGPAIAMLNYFLQNLVVFNSQQQIRWPDTFMFCSDTKRIPCVCVYIWRRIRLIIIGQKIKLVWDIHSHPMRQQHTEYQITSCQREPRNCSVNKDHIVAADTELGKENFQITKQSTECWQCILINHVFQSEGEHCTRVVNPGTHCSFLRRHRPHTALLQPQSALPIACWRNNWNASVLPTLPCLSFQH